MSRKINPNQKHYLSNKDLYCEIIVSQAQGKLTNKAAKMIMVLGKNVVRKMYYKDPDDRHDCLQEAMFDVFKGWHNFDPEKGDNCFAYYTEIIKRGLAKSWNKLHDKNLDFISLQAMNENGDLFDRF